MLRWIKGVINRRREKAYLKHLKYHRLNKNTISPENEVCPKCGYYCFGEGGDGCIDKPRLCCFRLKVGMNR